MPHPNPNFGTRRTGRIGQKNPTVCAKCHGLNVDFCNNCHHGTTLGFAINPKLTWKQQHPPR